MMMCEAHHINYNYITDFKLCDKKEGMFVLDNFLGVYSPIIKKNVPVNVNIFKKKSNQNRDKNNCYIIR